MILVTGSGCITFKMPLLINTNAIKSRRLTISQGPILVMSLNQTLEALTVSLQIQIRRLGLSINHKLYQHYYSTIWRSQRSTRNNFFHTVNYHAQMSIITFFYLNSQSSLLPTSEPDFTKMISYREFWF